MDLLDGARSRLGAAIFARVAGDEGPLRRDRIHGSPGPRRFDPADPIWRVHSDASMFVGGLRALLLQSLHPLAMAAVDQHSGFRGDPWGRLQRTSGFLAETTFAPVDQADRAISIVRAVHAHISGTAPDGRRYAADDPHLLRWVHVAEVDSFLRAHDCYGAVALTDAERDRYVAQAAITGELLGADPVPRTVAELDAALAAYRPELASSAAARATARFLIVHPPVPLALRAPYGLLTAAAVGLLPRWARWPLRLPWLPVVEGTAVRAAGTTVTSAIRWAMRPLSHST
ncbi:oxygenase MpaB family protein [uncultured Aeromicrobium sp.]|uniref:oxygenase MpaB family protein n=1 Tax=uncultured Aeromicrobium sp. TaxID=337820 RepID=UPI0025F2E3A8|nr:oxygenase MpaB family protein [uncultured Aeromicrobium sp.]